MTRSFPPRPALSAALILLVLTSISLTAWDTPTSAEPSQETARSRVSINTSLASLAQTDATPHFAFSMLDQAATTITKIICPNPACTGGGTTTTLNPGLVANFLVTVANAQASPVTITDFWQAGLVFQNGTGCGAPTSTTAPSFVGQVSCTTANGQVRLTFLVSPMATTPSAAHNLACVPSDAAGTLTCSEVTVTIVIPGDFNADGFVDIRDYGVWRANFGQMNCGNPADADRNCLVDIRDYAVWRQHFGEGTPP